METDWTAPALCSTVYHWLCAPGVWSLPLSVLQSELGYLYCQPSVDLHMPVSKVHTMSLS